MASVQSERIVLDEDRLKLLELASLCHVPMALYAVINLDVFDIISKSGKDVLTAYEIVKDIPACKFHSIGSVSLERILRLLASRSIFNEVTVVNDHGKKERRYGLTNLSKKYLVKNEKGVSLAPWVLFLQDEIMIKPWHYLSRSIIDGSEPVSVAHGKQIFELARDNETYSNLLNMAMANHTITYMHAVLEEYSGFKHINTLVDVGGGIGTALKIITEAYPEINGVNFDLPHVIEKALPLKGIKHVGGNMFEKVPNGDAIFMKWILHDWSDENCVKLLKNCYKALPEHGKVIIVDSLLPLEAREDLPSQIKFGMDMFMLTYTNGKERTLDELNEIAKAAGFNIVKLMLTLDFISIVEMYKI